MSSSCCSRALGITSSPLIVRPDGSFADCGCGRQYEPDLLVGNTGSGLFDPQLMKSVVVFAPVFMTQQLTCLPPMGQELPDDFLISLESIDMMALRDTDLTRALTVPMPEILDGELLLARAQSKQAHTDKGVIYAVPWLTDDEYLLIPGGYQNATINDVGNLVSKSILMLSLGGNERFSSDHVSGTDLGSNHKPIVILDTGAEVSVTGDKAIFFPVSFEPEGFNIRAANGDEMTSNLCGFVFHAMCQINYVYLSEDVGPRTIISGPELDVLGYRYTFEGGVCEVWDKGTLVGKGYLVENKRYFMEYLKIPLDRATVSPQEAPEVLLPEGPLSVVTSVWKAIRTVFRRFAGSLLNPASEQAPRRPPV